MACRLAVRLERRAVIGDRWLFRPGYLAAFAPPKPLKALKALKRERCNARATHLCRTRYSEISASLHCHSGLALYSSLRTDRFLTTSSSYCTGARRLRHRPSEWIRAPPNEGEAVRYAMTTALHLVSTDV